MESISIEATESTPAIKFESDGKLAIEGRSLRLYVNEFYQPLMDWVKALKLEDVTIDINLEYVDTGCSVLLYQLLKELDNNAGIKNLIVNWHYEEVDYDTLDDGMILKGILKKAEFRFHEHPEAFCII